MTIEQLFDKFSPYLDKAELQDFLDKSLSVFKKVNVGKAKDLSAFQMLGKFLKFVENNAIDLQIEESKHQFEGGDYLCLKNGFSSLMNKLRDDFDVQFNFELKSIN